MARPTVAVSLPDAEGEAVLEQLTEAAFGTVTLSTPSDLATVIGGSLPVTIAVLDGAAGYEELGAAVRAARSVTPAIPVLVIANADDLEALDEAGILGPHDEVALRPVDADGLRWRVEAMLIRSQVDAEQHAGAVLARGAVEADWAARSPIIAVFNPKGGVGKTTIATNLASAMQNRRDRRVLLIDADTVTGHVTMSLGMETSRTIADAWVDEDEGGPPESLLDLAAVHESGIRVAALVSSPLMAHKLDPERVADAILAARWGVDVIVIDLHPSYSDLNQTLFGIADRIVVPVTPDLPAIRAAVQVADVSIELGVRDRLAMVINRANSGVSVKQIEQTVGLPNLGLIRSGGMLFVRAANEGRTVTELFPKEGVAQDFEHLADRLLGLDRTEGAPAGNAPRSVLGGIFGRKEPVRA